MKLFLFRKRYLAIPGAILAICALCLITTLPSYVTTAATQRQLPIYCVQRDHKVVSLSFDAAWGDAILRHLGQALPIQPSDSFLKKSLFFRTP